MPYWIPKQKTIQDEIADEESKILSDQLENAIRKGYNAPLMEQEYPQAPAFRMPTATAPTEFAPQPQVAAPSPVELEPFAPQVAEVPPIAPEPPVEEELALPLWQRALQIFSAPFEWVDENVIKPGLSFTATGTGAIPDIERKTGEDFWDWKRRSWAAWDAPGIDMQVPWGDGTWRIDMKGILELAPWLLIPGVGQVGTATRTAGGIAGALGKLGKAGKVAGLALELSPWGLVEKTAGAAMRGVAKGIFKGTGKLSEAAGKRIFGAVPEPKAIPAIQRFTSFFDDIVAPQRKLFREAVETQLTPKQAGRLQGILKLKREGKISAIEATKRMNSALKVGGIKGEFAVDISKYPRKNIEKDVEVILNTLIDNTEKGFVARDSSIAMLELLTHGTLPQKHNIRDWARALGPDFAKSANLAVPTSKLDKVLDVLNIPRAVLASADISGVARQGLVLGLVHPTKVPRSFGRMMKAMFSEKLAIQMDDVLRADPVFREFTDLGGYIAPLRKAGTKLAQREESFMSALAEKVPFVRRSERAFNTYLNELRLGSFKAASGAMQAQGATKLQMTSMAKFINLASGRGELPKSLEKFAPVLNTILFSPRLQASRLELPRQLGRMLLSGNPYMRKEAGKALATFLGGGAALLLLLKQSGAAEVEDDPRSADFGKIKIGETRLDVFTGYLQYARFMAQMLTGQRKTAYGNMNKADRFETAFRFMQSKSSPAFGLMVDLLRGENYRGEKLFKDTTGFIDMARNRLLPLAIQDTMDAMEQSGINGLWTAAPATIGIGTLTYVNEFVRTKDRIAQQEGYETWDEIDPKRQRELENSNAELQAAYIEFDRQVMGTAWGDYRLAGNAVDEVFKDAVNQAVDQYKQTGDGVQFREKIGDAFTARRGGYDARDKQPQFSDIVKRMQTEDTAEALVGLGPEQLAIKTYNDALYGDDMYDEFGDYRFDEAETRKQQLRQQLGNELFEYVEEYSGLKYENFPAEFQELAKAKKIMKPYWDVKNQVERIFGKAFADTSRGQSLVSKMRKIKRLQDPEIAKYYNMFYKNI